MAKHSTIVISALMPARFRSWRRVAGAEAQVVNGRVELVAWDRRRQELVIDLNTRQAAELASALLTAAETAAAMRGLTSTGSPRRRRTNTIPPLAGR
jgi:hypothetical protein